MNTNRGSRRAVVTRRIATALAVAALACSAATATALARSPSARAPRAIPSLTAPSDVTANAGAAAVALSWMPPVLIPGGQVLGYLVSIDDTTTGVTSAPRPTDTAATAYAIGHLHPGDVYTFTVAAITTAGTTSASAPSNPAVPTVATVAVATTLFGGDPTVVAADDTGGGLRATGTGIGIVTIGTYLSATETGLTDGTDYMSVSASGLQAVKLQICGVPAGTSLDWWDISLAVPAWTPTAPQPAIVNGCVTLPIGAQSSPSIAVAERSGALLALKGPAPPQRRPTRRHHRRRRKRHTS